MIKLKSLITLHFNVMPKHYKTISTALDEPLREAFDKVCLKEDVSRHTKLLNMIKEEIKDERKKRGLESGNSEDNRHEARSVETSDCDLPPFLT